MKEDKILEVLETQTFADFYNLDMDAYIVGDVNAPTKEKMLKEIRRVFKRAIEEV